MKIYRIESIKSGKGPFHATESQIERLIFEFGYDWFKSLACVYKKGCYCAFDSLESLKFWFDRKIDVDDFCDGDYNLPDKFWDNPTILNAILLSSDFLILEIEVTEIEIKSLEQVVFCRSKVVSAVEVTL